MRYLTRAAALIIVSIIGCDAVNPLSPKTTHTMEEVVKDISQRRRNYEDQTITIKATVKDIQPLTANEDEIKLVTNNPIVHFDILTKRGYKVGRSYVFTIHIKYVIRDRETRFYIDGFGNRRVGPPGKITGHYIYGHTVK